METDSREKLLEKIFEAFVTITENPEKFKDWVNEPNEALNGVTPAQLFDAGKGNYILTKLEEFINNGGIY